MANNKTFYRNAQRDELSFGDIFSDVFKKHTEEDTARVFIAGTPLTTPQEADMLKDWSKPFMFLRFFFGGLIFLLAMYYTAAIYNNPLILFALLSLISWLVPVTMLLLGWELHIPRNISLYEVFKMVFGGGVISFFAALLLFQLSESFLGVELSASWAGLAEEPAKLIAICWFLGKRKKDRPYALNGMLIGLAVGTGFAAMESVGYVFSYQWEYNTGMEVAVLRSVSGVVSHGLFASIYGAALAKAKGREKLSPLHLVSPGFLISFVIAILLHFANNTSWGLPAIVLPLLGTVPVETLVLDLIGILVWLPVVRSGINEAVAISVAANGDRLTIAVEHNVSEPEHVYTPDPQPPVYTPDPQPPVWKPQPEHASGSVYYLLGISGDWKDRKIDLNSGAQMVAGRNSQVADLVLSHSPRVSGEHCQIRFLNDRLTVIDLNSTNGTYIGNQRLKPGVETAVPEGQKFYLGDTSCGFRFVKEKRRAPYAQ